MAGLAVHDQIACHAAQWAPGRDASLHPLMEGVPTIRPGPTLLWSPSISKEGLSSSNFVPDVFECCILHSCQSSFN